MIGPVVTHYLFPEELLIPAENVAHVMPEHSVMHATLVLSSLGYNRIPVIDDDGKFAGTIGLSTIMGDLLDWDEISGEKMKTLKVEDVMDRKNNVLVQGYDDAQLLREMVHFNFLPVVDEKNVFLGIVTRKEILKRINFLAHELEKEYKIEKK